LVTLDLLSFVFCQPPSQSRVRTPPEKIEEGGSGLNLGLNPSSEVRKASRKPTCLPVFCLLSHLVFCLLSFVSLSANLGFEPHQRRLEKVGQDRTLDPTPSPRSGRPPGGPPASLCPCAPSVFCHTWSFVFCQVPRRERGDSLSLRQSRVRTPPGLPPSPHNSICSR
jgi:hypothetical protein